MALLLATLGGTLRTAGYVSDDNPFSEGSSVELGPINGLDGPHVIITGANVHIRNGDEQTGTTNGVGNLLIGYNEEPTSPGLNPGDRGGSHNFVVGDRHRYSSFDGLVAGFANTISGPAASVSGGSHNTASGATASVSGGAGNTASGTQASVSGGQDNTASNDRASVSGGSHNTASGPAASVSGGSNNTASGLAASVSGGAGNTASGLAASVSGGFNDAASGNFDWVAGTLFEED